MKNAQITAGARRGPRLTLPRLRIRGALWRGSAGAVTAMLVVAIGYRLADLTWTVAPGTATADVLPRAEMSVPPPSPPAANAELAGLHLFGQAGSESGLGQGPIALAAPSPALRLHGVFTHPDPQRGAAIIGRDDGEQRLFRVGEQVFGGRVLEAVQAKQVTLRDGASRSALAFKKPSQASVVAQHAEPEREPAPTSELANYRRLILEDPQRAQEYFAAEPVRLSGRLQGYRLLPGQDAEAYQLLDLRPTDIITSINGVALSEPHNVGRILEELSASERVQVSMIRNGRTRSTTLSFN